MSRTAGPPLLFEELPLHFPAVAPTGVIDIALHIAHNKGVDLLGHTERIIAEEKLYGISILAENEPVKGHHASTVLVVCLRCTLLYGNALGLEHISLTPIKFLDVRRRVKRHFDPHFLTAVG